MVSATHRLCIAADEVATDDKVYDAAAQKQLRKGRVDAWASVRDKFKIPPPKPPRVSTEEGASNSPGSPVPKLDLSPKAIKEARKSKKAPPAMAPLDESQASVHPPSAPFSASALHDEETTTMGVMDLETPRVAGYDEKGAKLPVLDDKPKLKSGKEPNAWATKKAAAAQALSRRDPILAIRQQATVKLRDMHGFIVEPENQQQYRAYQEKEASLIKLRAMKWREGLKPHRAKLDFNKRKRWHEKHGGEQIPPRADLGLLCVQGFPNELRGKIWLRVSGGLHEKDRQPSKYQELLKSIAIEPPQELRTIECDLDRTFPNHETLDNLEGIAKLRRILQAYAVYNPEIGYCQSMNFLAGFLLLHMAEEDCFWVLVRLVEHYLVDYFSVEMRGWLVDQRPQAHPKLHQIDPNVISKPKLEGFC